MGEPRPGDYPDPLYVKGTNIKLKTNQTALAGSFVIWDSTGTPAWKAINPATVPRDGTVLGGAVLQLQQEIDSRGKGDAISSAGAMGVGSWIFAQAIGKINPNDYLMFTKSGANFGFANTRNVSVSAAAVAANVVTVSTRTNHNLKVGDKVSLVGMTPITLNGALVVTGITDADTFTAAKVLANVTATAHGTANTPVTGEFAQGQYIQTSGDTYEEGAADGDTIVVSVLKGGQSQ